MQHPLINSHHDLLVSTTLIPAAHTASSQNVSSAPKVPNNRTKILWSEEDIEAYQSLVGHFLPEIGHRWSDSTSKISISILLDKSKVKN